MFNKRESLGIYYLIPVSMYSVKLSYLHVLTKNAIMCHFVDFFVANTLARKKLEFT